LAGFIFTLFLFFPSAGLLFSLSAFSILQKVNKFANLPTGVEPNNYLRVILQKMDYKSLIQKEFDTLRLADLSAGRKFQAIAYSKFLAKLKAVPFVRSFEDVAEAAGKGKIAEKVQEIMATGELGAAKRAREETNVEAYEELLAVYGVGPVKARAFIESGIGGVADLRSAVASGQVELTDAQQHGLDNYEDLRERIPRAEMEQHAVVLEDAIDPVLTDIAVVGSYRRGAESSGDIDVLLTMPSSLDAEDIAIQFTDYIDRLIVSGYITAILARGVTKCLAICQLPDVDGSPSRARRLDLLMIPRHEYAYSLLYFTGSDQFNVAMRRWALEKGYTMNEHGLTLLDPTDHRFPKGAAGEHCMRPTKEDLPEPPFMAKEQDIFRFLGLKFVLPTERKDAGQIVAAAPSQKVKLVLKKKA
jgi:DNA polymerase beta